MLLLCVAEGGRGSRMPVLEEVLASGRGEHECFAGTSRMREMASEGACCERGQGPFFGLWPRG